MVHKTLTLTFNAIRNSKLLTQKANSILNVSMHTLFRDQQKQRRQTHQLWSKMFNLKIKGNSWVAISVNLGLLIPFLTFSLLSPILTFRPYPLLFLHYFLFFPFPPVFFLFSFPYFFFFFPSLLLSPLSLLPFFFLSYPFLVLRSRTP